MLGLGLSWTLFDGFANSAKAAQYVSDANKMDLAYHTLTNLIEIEIRSDIKDCSAADSNYVASQVMFNAAKESYELTNSNFKQGSGQFADLQLSDETLRQAELGLVNAKYRQIRSRAALMIAMGQDIVQLNSEKDNSK
jgi:outer membrane protein TolC